MMCSDTYCNNSAKLNEFQNERDEISIKLTELYERWETVNLE